MAQPDSYLTDARRPIQIFSSPPPPKPINWTISDSMIHGFLQEVGSAPHRNDSVCASCAHVYLSPPRDAKCVQRVGLRICGGTVVLQWDEESAREELCRYLNAGGIALAQSLTSPAQCAGFATCVVCDSSTVLGVTNMPMTLLGQIYSRVGREGPYLVINHLWIGEVGISREQSLLQGLIWKVVETVLRRESLSQACVLVLVDAAETERRHRLLRAQFMSSKAYAPIVDRGSSRALLSLKLGERAS
ncbi:hypothetical protein HQ487_03500 [Candidatus Uhrbacteria bacterium]|nr:hypothetical protein [Candidatus Uhrbacteria bacterium]